MKTRDQRNFGCARRARSTALRVAVPLAFVTVAATLPALAQSVEDLKDLSLEELANINVSSVSKTSEKLSDAPAAIYVITSDDIMRSGAHSLPEMLRLAPNLQVSQINAYSYAISARGFNLYGADKLLVLIDGRSVYSPYFSGVFWDTQEVLPEDVERIEVISGPGATLWGANAVNGVINIITKNSKDTQGGSVAVGTGNLENRGSAQYGGKAGNDVSYRVYGGGFGYDHDVSPLGTNAGDAWRKGQGGFRTDWTPSGDLVTLEGNLYDGSEQQVGTPVQTLFGQNLTGRWNHQMAGGSSLQIQASYSDDQRFVQGNGGDRLNVFELEIQHNFNWGSSQAIVWGADYRVSQDHFDNVFHVPVSVFFSPATRVLQLGDVFVQDTISISDTVKLIPGLKLEELAPYTGIEFLPSLRFSWKASDTNLLWAAVSRAVRDPSREDRDLFETVGSLQLLAGGNFQPEKLIAYEVGYRAQPTDRLSFSISAYYNQYQDLRSVEFSSGGGLPIVFGNGMEGDTYGVEMWGSYRVTDWWRLQPGLDWLHENLKFKPGSSGINGIAQAGNDPTHQFMLRSSMDLPYNTTLDLNLRNVGSLPNPAVPGYTELDARLGWNVTPSWNLSLTGANLLHSHHIEYIAASSFAPTEVGRSLFVEARCKF